MCLLTNGFQQGFRPTLSSVKPIYVSLGHRISLDSAVEVVKITCKYRVPEPIRQVHCLLHFDIPNSFSLDYCGKWNVQHLLFVGRYEIKSISPKASTWSFKRFGSHGMGNFLMIPPFL